MSGVDLVVPVPPLDLLKTDPPPIVAEVVVMLQGPPGPAGPGGGSAATPDPVTGQYTLGGV